MAAGLVLGYAVVCRALARRWLPAPRRRDPEGARAGFAPALQWGRGAAVERLRALHPRGPAPKKVCAMVLVSESMNRSLATVSPDASMAEAVAVVQRTGAEHVLVMDEQTLVGILCACELRGAPPGDRVSDRMSGPVATVRPDVRVEDAAALLRACSLGCLPVAVGGLILGTLSEAELIRAGVSEPRPHCRREHRRRASAGRA